MFKIHLYILSPHVALLTFKILLLPFQNLSGVSSLNPQNSSQKEEGGGHLDPSPHSPLLAFPINLPPSFLPGQPDWKNLYLLPSLESDHILRPRLARSNEVAVGILGTKKARAPFPPTCRNLVNFTVLLIRFHPTFPNTPHRVSTQVSETAS